MHLAGRQKINLFVVLLHSHLLGRGLTVRHIRYISKQRLTFKEIVFKICSFKVACGLQSNVLSRDVQFFREGTFPMMTVFL